MKRGFFYLAGVTVLAIMALWLFAGKDYSSEQHRTNDLFLPDIAGQINAVNRVEIIAAGNQTVAGLVRSGDHWQLEQMSGYRADWPRLQKLLAALATARVLESKTDKPEYYARLGVEDVSAGEAGSVLVKLSTGDLNSNILIGHQAEGRRGQYVRLHSEAASALIDQQLEVSTQLLDWADSRIVDIGSTEVAEVEIIHPTGERILVMRISADQTDFDLAGLPPGREIKSSWAVNSFGSVFTLLELESVRPAGFVDWSNAVNMRLLMFSAVEIMADMIESEGEYLLRLSASHPAARVAQQDVEKQAHEEVAKTVESINQRTKGWVYTISKAKFDAMVKKPEDLLKPLETS